MNKLEDDNNIQSKENYDNNLNSRTKIIQKIFFDNQKNLLEYFKKRKLREEGVTDNKFKKIN